MLLKLTLTPVLIAAASLAQRRWGSLVGGLIAGLPLTSAPVSLFLALDHGPAFAARAAIGTLLGVIAMSMFCAVYVYASARRGAPRSVLLASLACAATTWTVSLLPQTLPIAAAIAFPALALIVIAIGRPEGNGVLPRPPWWDLPARMVVAACVVVLITASASTLGPSWSGLLSTLPIFGAVMGVFSHRIGGPAAAHELLRGFALGAFGAAGFFTIVGALVERAGLAATYGAAVAVALALVVASQRLALLLTPRTRARRRG